MTEATETKHIMPSRDELMTRLAEVMDPEINMSIVELGLVYDIEPDANGDVIVTMTLTSPGCPAGPEIISATQREVHMAFPDLAEVNVHLTWTPFWNPDMMSDEAKDEFGIF